MTDATFPIRTRVDLEGAKDGFERLEELAKNSWTEINSAIEVAQKAFSAVNKTVGDWVRSANEAERAQRGLATALALQGDASDATLVRMQSFNSALMAQIGMDDDAIAAIETKLLALGVLPDQLERATRATLGLADATGKDMTRASKEVARAFEEGGAKARELEALFAITESRALTFAGQVDRLDSNWGELEETLGRLVTQSPVVREELEGINSVLGDINATAEDDTITTWFDRILRKLQELGTDPDVQSAMRILSGGPFGAFAEGARLTLPDINSDQFKKGLDEAKNELTLFMKLAESAANISSLGFVGSTPEEIFFPTADPNEIPQALRDKEARQVAELETKPEAQPKTKKDKTKKTKKKGLGDISPEAEGILELSAGVNEEEQQLLDEQIAARERHLDRLDRLRLDELKIESDRAEQIAKIKLDEAKERRKIDAQIEKQTNQFLTTQAAMAVQGVGQFVGAIAGGLITGSLDVEAAAKQLFGGMLRQLGTALVSIGTGVIAAGIAGTAAPIFGALLGGPAAIAAGAGLVAAGGAIAGIGAAIASSGSRPAAAPAEATATPRVPDFSSAESRGFTDSQREETRNTTINISFSQGVVYGTPRQIGQQLRKYISDANSLRPVFGGGG